jgi:malonyl-CoA O-methyltransferase
MSLLEPREAYRLWAPSYDSGNAITHLEQTLVERLGPSPVDRHLLDAGCGTGWRMAGTGAVQAVGVDLSPEMLSQARRNAALTDSTLLEGDLRALPVPDSAFDLVWCRLAIGYVVDCASVYAELARAAASGAHVIVTDFHPAARAAGLRRGFRHGGVGYEVVSHVHSIERQIEAARNAGLALRAQAEAEIGPGVRHFYQQAGREALYDGHVGLPVVLALAFTRGA